MSLAAKNHLLRSSRTLMRRSVAKSARKAACLATAEPSTSCTNSSSNLFAPPLRSLDTKAATATTRRNFATGTRGARGMGWYTNYRAGKGGRHLQGEYFDRDSVEECQQWNEAVLELGSRAVYLDVVLEPRSSGLIQTPNKKQGTVLPDDLDTLTGEKHRLVMDLAATVMPETTQNFVDLCLAASSDADVAGYKGSLLYRFERNVGLCGGDVLTNTGRTGQAAQGAPLTYTVQNDPLALWHLAGTVTMLVPTVGEIDSRFVICTETAQHLDGINRAFGRLRDDSLSLVQKWHATLLTRNGVPTSYDLVVVGCGTMAEDDEDEKSSSSGGGDDTPRQDDAA